MATAAVAVARERVCSGESVRLTYSPASFGHHNTTGTHGSGSLALRAPRSPALSGTWDGDGLWSPWVAGHSGAVGAVDASATGLGVATAAWESVSLRRAVSTSRWGGVWEARWSGVPAAVTLFNADDSPVGVRAAVVHHAHMLHALRHPHVVSLYAYCDAATTAAGAPALALIHEAAPGGNLATAAVGASRAKVLTWCRDTAAGLAYVHDAGLVHGAVCAATVVIGPSGAAQLTAFGAARRRPAGDVPEFDAGGVAAERIPDPVTGATVKAVLGVDAAPELTCSADMGGAAVPSVSSDVWAWGRMTLRALDAAAAADDVPLPPALAPLLAAATAADPSARPTMAALLRTLDAALGLD